MFVYFKEPIAGQLANSVQEMTEEDRRLLNNRSSESSSDDVKPNSPPPPYQDPVTGGRDVQYKKLPIVIWMLEKAGLMNFRPLLR